MKYLIATFHVMNYNEGESMGTVFSVHERMQKTDRLPEAGRESVSSYCIIRQTGKEGMP